MKLEIQQHHHFDGERELHRKIDRLFTLIENTKGQLMSAMDDLRAALTDLVNEAVSDVETLITKLAAANNSADAMALTQQARDGLAKLKDDMAKVMEPAPAPAPVEPPTQAPPDQA